MLMLVEALVLPGATRSDQLSDQPSGRLAQAKPEDYVKLLGGRNRVAP